MLLHLFSDEEGRQFAAPRVGDGRDARGDRHSAHLETADEIGVDPFKLIEDQ